MLPSDVLKRGQVTLGGSSSGPRPSSRCMGSWTLCLVFLKTVACIAVIDLIGVECLGLGHPHGDGWGISEGLPPVQSSLVV